MPVVGYFTFVIPAKAGIQLLISGFRLEALRNAGLFFKITHYQKARRNFSVSTGKFVPRCFRYRICCFKNRKSFG